MLEGSAVTMKFGGLVAIDSVDFSIQPEEIVGLIGPNGAGKTTLFNTISGVYEPTEGSIHFNGSDITGRDPNLLVKDGIVRTFQTPRTFDQSTVLENVMMGAVFGDGASMELGEEIARKCLQFIGLLDKIDAPVGSLTLVDRKLLELARGIATDPDIILVDEIASGLSPGEIADLISILEDVRSEMGVTIFWIEHIMDAIMNATDRIIVLHQGSKIAEGTPESVQENELVLDAYLGSETTA